MNVNDNHQTGDKSPISSVISLFRKAASTLNSGLGKLVDGLTRRIRHWETATSLRIRRLQVGFVFGILVMFWLVRFISLFNQPISQPTMAPQVILSTQRPPGLPPVQQPSQPQPQKTNKLKFLPSWMHKKNDH